MACDGDTIGAYAIDYFFYQFGFVGCLGPFIVDRRLKDELGSWHAAISLLMVTCLTCLEVGLGVEYWNRAILRYSSGMASCRENKAALVIAFWSLPNGSPRAQRNGGYVSSSCIMLMATVSGMAMMKCVLLVW